MFKQSYIWFKSVIHGTKIELEVQMKYSIVLVITLLISTNFQKSFASERITEEPVPCFPTSSLYYPPFNKSANSLSKADYEMVQRVLKKAFNVFLKEKMNKEIFFENGWDDSTVNAYCTRDMEDNPVIKIMGGMARHPDMTKDGLIFVACHELGHYLGGAPKGFRGRSKRRSWSSAEGQADYYAATKCLPQIFSNMKENEKVLKRASKEDLEKASRNCGKKDLVCKRIALAGFSATKVFHSVKDYEEFPDLSKRDSNVVYSVKYGHPSPQCRLDTVLRGANCDADPSVLFDPIDPEVGACHRHMNKAKSKKSARPLCWYLPTEKFD